MKIVINYKKLVDTLIILERNMSRRNTLPVLDSFLFKLSENGTLSITSSDLNNTLTAKVQIQNFIAEEAGESFLLNREELKILKNKKASIKAQELVKVFFDSETNVIEVEFESSKLYFKQSYDVKDFPTPIELESSKTLTVDAGFIDTVKRFNMFVCNDDLRPSFNTVWVDKMNIFASNAYIVGVSSLLPDHEGVFNLGYGVKTFLNVFGKSHEIVIKYDSKNVKFDSLTNPVNYTLQVRQIDDNIPNYKLVIPTNQPEGVAKVFNKQDFVNEVKMMKSVNENVFRFTKAGNLIKLIAQDLNYGRSYKIFLPSENEDTFSIGFSPNKMITLLKSIDSDEFKLGFYTSESGATIKQGSETFMIMPITLSND